MKEFLEKTKQQKQKMFNIFKKNKVEKFPVLKLQITEDTPVPRYETEGANGIDVRAMSLKTAYSNDIVVKEEILSLIRDKFEQKGGFIAIKPYQRVLFGTGIRADIPAGYEIQVRDRSGISLKRGLKVMNAPGTIDEDYTDEIGIILVNLTGGTVKLDREERIAQLVFAKAHKAELLVVEDISKDTSRLGGFGSTGTT